MDLTTGGPTVSVALIDRAVDDREELDTMVDPKGDFEGHAAPPAPWAAPSWDDVVRDHGARVYRLAYRLTGNQHDAEDLTQEVFVRVFRSLSQYTPGTFEGWLHRITTNLFLDQVRRKARIRFEGLPEDAGDRLASREPGPSQLLADRTYEAELRKLITVELLIVDDFGLDAMDVTESHDAYEILTERHRLGSMIVTSNRGPDEWLATFADPMRAQSAIDRFTSNAYDLVVEGESYRPRLKPRLASGQTAAA